MEANQSIGQRKSLLLIYIIISIFIVGSTFIHNPILEFSLVLIGVIIFLILSFGSTIRLSNKLSNLSQYANDVATGNLDESLEFTGKDEFNPVYQSINQAVTNMRNLVQTLNQGMKKVDENSDELSATMTELYYVMEDIKETIHEMTQGSMELSAATEQISSSAEEIEHSIKKLAQQANNGKNIAQEIKERGTRVKIEAKKSAKSQKKCTLKKRKIF